MSTKELTITSKWGMKIQEWAYLASRITLHASKVKDWRLTRKVDRRFKQIAIELANGRGYVIATESELAERWPEVFQGARPCKDGRKFIWAVDFSKTRTGNKMCFLPIR